MINQHPVAGDYPHSLPEGWFYDFDIEAYRRFFSKLPDNSTVVEIGVWKGRSICSVHDIIKRKGILVHAVDPFTGSANEKAHEGVDKSKQRQEFDENMKLFGLESYVEVHEVTSDVFFSYASHQFANLIFIDGDHSYEQVSKDITNALGALKDGGVLIGHDYNWVDDNGDKPVNKAVKEHFHTEFFGSIWQIKPTVRASISSRGRMMTTTPLAVMSVINQDTPPDYLVIFDDTPDKEKEKWFETHVWKQLFSIMNAKCIKWEVMLSDGFGQVKNHQAVLDMTKQRKDAKYIWRVDDDNIPEYNVLSTLLKTIESTSCDAVAACTPEPDAFLREKPVSSFTDAGLILESSNVQWFYDHKIHHADHLYSSFLYNPDRFESYNLELSTVGHREETFFTLGKECTVDNSVINWHIRNPQGGIRSFSREEMWNEDEAKFRKYYFSKFKPFEKIGCINGLGDAYALKSVLPDIIKWHGRVVLVTNQPDVFADMISRDFKVIPIWESREKANEEWNVYRFMDAQSAIGINLTLKQSWLKLYTR